MRCAIDGAPASGAEVLKCGLAAMLMQTNRAEAVRILETVRSDVRHSDPVQDFSEIAAGNLSIVQEILRGSASQP